MKYMLIMRATDGAFAEFANIDFNEILESMGRFGTSRQVCLVAGGTRAAA